ncbi:GUN4 domain-containing protein [Scytonema sp. NUACC21]
MALESELRSVRGDLSEENLCNQLEKSLQNLRWEEADRETDWIFYQVMLLHDYKNFEELFKNFPCETLKNINQLWLKYSNGNFGFSVQREIWKDMGQSMDRYFERVVENRAPFKDIDDIFEEKNLRLKYPMKVFHRSVSRVEFRLMSYSSMIMYLRSFAQRLVDCNIS